MKIIFLICFCFGFIWSDIMRPEDNFGNINYQEDMGICIGITGNNSNMTDYEKFQAFNQHNCLPVVVLEGVESTKLQLMITDCDALGDDVLENCNIMTIKNKHRFIWFQPPGLIKCESNVSEFLVWISFMNDPVGMLGGGKCMNALFGNQLDLLKFYHGQEPPYIFPDFPGLSITWYGNTPQTLNSSKCGVTAGEDLGSMEVPIKTFMGFQSFYDYTIGMGYQPGLTLLPIPYDWRRMAGNHEVTTTFQRTIEYAYTITGKKVVITAHSYGCLAFLTIINSLSQSFKDKYIDSFLGLACAWGGSTQALSYSMVGMDLGWWEFGYTINDTRAIITSLTSFVDLQPKGIFNLSTEWGQAISERAKQEAGWNSANPPQNISFPWFPTPENDCYLDRSVDNLCGLHLYNFFENPVAYTPKTTYKLNQSSIIELLEQYMLRTEEEISFQQLVNEGKVSQSEQEQTWGRKKLIPKDRISLMMQMSMRNGVNRLINPGVKIHHIYGGHYQTNTWYNITGNPRDDTDKGNTVSNDSMKTNTHWGDDTVNIDNAIVPSLKWAWDFDNGVQNAKPVHLIDYCSNYSQLMYKDSTGKYTTQFKNITKNTYNGIMCTNRPHDQFPDDEFIDKYGAVLLQSGYKLTYCYYFIGQPGQPDINLTEAEVNLFLKTCPHIMAPWTQQSFHDLLSYGSNHENLEQNKKNYDFPFSNPSSQLIQLLEDFYDSLQQVQEQIQ